MIQTLELTDAYVGGNSSYRLFRDTTSGAYYVFQDGYWPYGKDSSGAANSGVRVNVAQTTGPDSNGVYTITMWSDVLVLRALEHLLPLVRDGSKVARIGWGAGVWITTNGAGVIVDQTSTPTAIAAGDVLASDWYIVYP